MREQFGLQVQIWHRWSDGCASQFRLVHICNLLHYQTMFAQVAVHTSETAWLPREDGNGGRRGHKLALLRVTRGWVFFKRTGRLREALKNLLADFVREGGGSPPPKGKNPLIRKWKFPLEVVFILRQEWKRRSRSDRKNGLHKGKIQWWGRCCKVIVRYNICFYLKAKKFSDLLTKWWNS